MLLHLTELGYEVINQCIVDMLASVAKWLEQWIEDLTKLASLLAWILIQGLSKLFAQLFTK